MWHSKLLTVIGRYHLCTRATEHKGCNWACKLTDGCSLKSCVRPHLQAYATEIKSTQLHAAPLWLGLGVLNKCVVHLHLHLFYLHSLPLVSHSSTSSIQQVNLPWPAFTAKQLESHVVLLLSSRLCELARYNVQYLLVQSIASIYPRFFFLQENLHVCCLESTVFATVSMFLFQPAINNCLQLIQRSKHIY